MSGFVPYGKSLTKYALKSSTVGYVYAKVSSSDGLMALGNLYPGLCNPSKGGLLWCVAKVQKLKWTVNANSSELPVSNVLELEVIH